MYIYICIHICTHICFSSEVCEVDFDPSFILNLAYIATNSPSGFSAAAARCVAIPKHKWRHSRTDLDKPAASATPSINSDLFIIVSYVFKITYLFIIIFRCFYIFALILFKDVLGYKYKCRAFYTSQRLSLSMKM